MFVGALGSAGLSLWQTLRDSGGSSTTSATTGTSTASATSSTSSTTSATSGLSSADAKVVADFKSLLLDLQSGSTSTDTSAASSSSGTSATDGASDLVKDLRGLFGEFRKAGAHAHAGTGTAGTGTTGTSMTDTGTTGDNSLTQISSALTAYARQLGLTSSTSTTAGTSFSA